MYFNDNDAYCAEWLRNLYPTADIDSRSITEIQPGDLQGYRRVHLFAGIGGWEYALQLAGWPDDVPVWTGSCPCQPFSTAGKRQGTADSRHLWPEFCRLIAECRPPVVFGEQVASKDGRKWLAGVRADLEALGYGVGAADLCAAGVSAPHIRQRLYWVAYSTDFRREQWREGEATEVQRNGSQRTGEHSEPGYAGELSGRPEGLCAAGGLADSPCQSLGIARQPWQEHDVVLCLDGRYRRIPAIESGVFPVAHGVPAILGYRCSVCGTEREINGFNSGPTWTLPCSVLVSSNRMLKLWPSGAETASASHRPQPDEQLSREHQNSLLDLSPQVAPETPADIHLCRMREGICCQVEAQASEMLLCPVCQRVGPHLRSKAMAQSRVGRIRAYGNSIVPQVAAQFIRAFMEAVWTP